jgi:hypothetical protein
MYILIWILLSVTGAVLDIFFQVKTPILFFWLGVMAGLALAFSFR